MGKKAFLLLASLIFLTSMFSGVYAAEEYKLSDMIEPLKSFDLGAAYESFPFIFDLIIYFLFFISLAQVTLGKQFKGSGGRGLVVAAGLALAVAMTYWAYKTGFILGRVGPLAALLFAIVIAILVYRLLKGDEKVGTTIWIIIIIFYIGIFTFFPEIVSAMEENSYGRLALGFAALLFMISIPMALMNFMWGGLPGGKDEIGKGLWPSGEAERRARKAPDKTKENKEKEEKEEEEEKRKKKKEKEEKEETEKPIIRKIKEAKRAKKLLNKKELVEARKVLEKLKELKESLKKYKDNKIGVDKFKKDIEEGIKWIKDEGFNLLKDLKQEIYLEEVSDELKKKLGIKTDRSGVRQLIINEKNVLKNLFNLIDLFEKLGPVPNWSEESLKNAETYLHQMYKLTEILIELNIRELAYESKERVVSEGGGEEPVVKKTVTGTGVGEKAPSEIPLVSKVRGYIQTDLEYFIRESVYTKMIYKHARYISENLDNPDLRLKNKKGLNHMVSHLDALKRQESWQQLRARFSKLEGAMKELLSLPYFKQKLYERKKIIELLRQEHVFEAGLLQKTVEELEPMIKGKNLNQMNDDDWVKIRGTAARLHRGLQALVATLQNLEKILERAVEQ